MAGDSTRSAREDCRPGTCHRGCWRGAEQVDADVKSLHRAGFDSVRDGATAKSGAEQLLPGDDVVLSAGDPGDRSFDGLHVLSVERSEADRAIPRTPHMHALPRSLQAAPIVSFCR